MKKVLSAIFATIIVINLFSMAIISVSAANIAWPSLSSSAYCEFVAAATINVYRDSKCKTRGTASPAKSYNSYIESNDVCRIIEITSSYIKIEFPTSSGYRTGYVRRADILSVSAPSERVKSSSKTDTYKKASNTYYGYVEPGDTVWAAGTSGSYTRVIYTAKSGKRAYKLGYVLTKRFNDTIKGSAPQFAAGYGSAAAGTAIATSAQDIVMGSSTISFSYSSTKTGYTLKSNLTVNGTSIPVGSSFVTYSKNGKSSTTGAKDGCTYFRVGNNNVNANGQQCQAYARYIQYLIYGQHEMQSDRFVKVAAASEKYPTASLLKQWLQTAGVGAHIRTCKGEGHSFIVIGMNANGFYFTDANWIKPNIIRVGYFTWADFCNSKINSHNQIYRIWYYK